MIPKFVQHYYLYLWWGYGIIITSRGDRTADSSGERVGSVKLIERFVYTNRPNTCSPHGNCQTKFFKKVVDKQKKRCYNEYIK